MKDFMLLFRGGDPKGQPSPEEMERQMQAWGKWIEQLRKDGTFKAGDPLEAGGKVVAGTARLVTDGPYAEAKEVVGGYFVITAQSLGDATEISKACPIFANGGSVEVRPIRVIPM